MELLVEIQLRTKLQHIWATAVEIVDFFSNQELKLNKGEKLWKDFFKELSIVFYNIENKINTKKQTIENISNFEKKLKILEKLKTWNSTFKILDNLNDKKIKNSKNIEYYLLELDLNKKELQVKSFTKYQTKKTFDTYLDLEKNFFNIPEYDIVLVSVNSMKDLKLAYPNYFLDTTKFVRELNKILIQAKPKKDLLDFK